jgi:hypothetical protein
MIPLRGQGEPLPADCPYGGEWLIENKMFLYRSPELTQMETMAMFPGLNGELCFGFNARDMAEQLGIGSDAVFQHNRSRTLILVGIADVPPFLCGIAAKSYRFSIGGDRFADFTIEAGPQGTA